MGERGREEDGDTKDNVGIDGDLLIVSFTLFTVLDKWIWLHMK